MASEVARSDKTTERNSKVWVTNFSGHDYTAAKKFGDLEVITFGYTRIDNFNNLKLTIATKLVESHRDDWLCLSGMALLCTLCATIWFNMHGQIKLLIWERSRKDEVMEGDDEGTYHTLVINKDNLSTLVEMAEKGKTT